MQSYCENLIFPSLSLNRETSQLTNSWPPSGVFGKLNGSIFPSSLDEIFVTLLKLGQGLTLIVYCTLFPFLIPLRRIHHHLHHPSLYISISSFENPLDKSLFKPSFATEPFVYNSHPLGMQLYPFPFNLFSCPSSYSCHSFFFSPSSPSPPSLLTNAGIPSPSYFL